MDTSTATSVGLVEPTASFIAAVEERLAAILEQHELAAPTAEARQLLKRCRALILRAGKRSRPRLLYDTFAAYGGTDTRQLLDVGVALEFHHQFLLIHDDIMDNDTVRYDGPNMIGYYQPEYAQLAPAIPSSMALLSGNLMCTFALQTILEHPTLSAAHKVMLLQLLQSTNIGVHHGQQLDILNIKELARPVSIKKLLLTHSLKTALYSVHLPMQMAAELVGLDAQERRRIDSFARAFGILYQLIDDHSDYFENATSFDAHPKFRDFCQGKITYPLLYALQHANPAERQYLESFHGRKKTPLTELSTMVAVLQNVGAETASQRLIRRYNTAATQALKRLQCDHSQFETLLKTFTV